MSRYPVEFEIAGPAAMFSRPDTGSAPISYPVPTWSACKAMFESVARGFFGDSKQPQAFFCPTEVEIWRPIRYEKYVTNYRGPLRKSSQIDKQASYQLHATILVDVCFRIKGHCIPTGISTSSLNAPHALQEMFLRRLNKGFSKYAPCLGWKEFLPSYFGPSRNHDGVLNNPTKQIDLELSLPGFLLSMWKAPVNSNYAPLYYEAHIRGGVLRFPELTLRDGKVTFGGIPSVG